MSFAELVKTLRRAQQKNLRQFCREHGHDPSNWSKVERGVNAPPKDQKTIALWAQQLGLAPGTDAWQDFFFHADTADTYAARPHNRHRHTGHKQKSRRLIDAALRADRIMPVRLPTRKRGYAFLYVLLQLMYSQIAKLQGVRADDQGAREHLLAALYARAYRLCARLGIPARTQYRQSKENAMDAPKVSQCLTNETDETVRQSGDAEQPPAPAPPQAPAGEPAGESALS